MIKLFDSLKSSERIKSKFEILLKPNKIKKVDKLSLKLISGAESIFYIEMLVRGK
jgi:hypothetical protein